MPSSKVDGVEFVILGPTDRVDGVVKVAGLLSPLGADGVETGGLANDFLVDEAAWPGPGPVPGDVKDVEEFNLAKEARSEATLLSDFGPEAAAAEGLLDGEAGVDDVVGTDDGSFAFLGEIIPGSSRSVPRLTDEGGFEKDARSEATFPGEGAREGGT